MPPQVPKAGPGNRPVVVPSQDGVKETKSGNEQVKAKEAKPAPANVDSFECGKAKGGKAGGDSWFTALAEAMGKVASEKAEKIQGNETKPAQPKPNSPDAKSTKEQGIINDSINNAVKSIGEGLSGAARKQ